MKNNNTSIYFNINPYKGLHYYEEKDNNAFYGRQEDVEGLFDIIKGNNLTVVCGKSGIGKTSLLNAGLFPKLRNEGFLPISLRLNYAKDSPPIMQQIIQAILNIIEDSENPIQLKSKADNKPVKYKNQTETLWEHFHRFNHFDSSKGKEKTVTPVLVLDQFEEIVTLGKFHPDRKQLIDELYWLIENQIPTDPEKKKRIEDIDFSFTERPDVRVVISLREDFLPHLTEFYNLIPFIDQVKFRVTPLNGKQAREVIGMPGGFTDEDIKNDILRFFYPEGVGKEETVPDENLEIEPVLLSLLCYQLFNKQPLGSISKKEKEKILEDFYDSETKNISIKEEKFIESKLLTEGGLRTPFYLEPDHPLRDQIDQLVNRRILRKFHSEEKEYVEIIHDVLAPIIKEKRSRRSRKKYYSITALLVGFIFILFVVITAVHELYIREKVNRLTAESLVEFHQNQDNTKAIRIAGAAFDKRPTNAPARTCKVLTEIGYSSMEKPFYTTTLHHKSTIYTAYFSPDGKSILTASEDGTAKLWDLEGNLKADLNKHTARVFSAVFSPSGDRLLTASWDNTAKLWDKNGVFISDLKHDAIVDSAVFSGDGKLILTASRDGTARLWDHKGKFLRKLEHGGTVKSAVFSKDDSMVLTASWDKRAKLWRTGDGKLLNSLEHEGAVNSLAFSPDGSRILTASSDRSAILWNLEGKKQEELKHNGAVNSAVFSEDGSRIITASSDHTAKLWDSEGKLTIELKHNGAVTSTMFSKDGSMILTTSDIGTAKVWDNKGHLLAELKKQKTKIRTAVFSQDSNQVLTASDDGTAMVWLLKNDIVIDLNMHNGEVSFAAFSPDGNRIITTSYDKTAILWNSKGQLLENLIGHTDNVISAAFSPDRSNILTASDDATAKVWDTHCKIQADLKHNGAVSSVVFSPDSSRILTAARDGTARLWGREGDLLRVIRHKNAAVYSAVFSPKGHQILTASEDGTAKLWDMEDKPPIVFQHEGEVYSAVFSPNGRQILTASGDKTAKVWNLEGKLLVDLNQHEDKVTSAVFSPDGSQILTTSYDGTAKLWNLEGQLLVSLEHYGPISSAVFSGDGRFILTASRDGTAKLWNLEGQFLADLNKHKDIVRSAVFSPDGRRILTASGDGTAKVWLTPLGIYEWLKTANIPSLSKEDKINLGVR